MSAGFAGSTFSATRDRVDRLTHFVAEQVGADSVANVLDLGCGSGEQLMSLARALPKARLVGIDVSGPSISRALESREVQCARDRLTYLCGDYLELALGPFELILADSTLQNIEHPTDVLFTKISAELSEGGRLVCTLPYGCAYNHVLWTARRVLRLIRSSAVDSLITHLGSKLHRGELSEEMIRERVHYAYRVPWRYDGRALRAALLEGPGLRLLNERTWPHASFAQPRHRLLVFTASGTDGEQS